MSVSILSRKDVSSGLLSGFESFAIVDSVEPFRPREGFMKVRVIGKDNTKLLLTIPRQINYVARLDCVYFRGIVTQRLKKVAVTMTVDTIIKVEDEEDINMLYYEIMPNHYLRSLKSLKGIGCYLEEVTNKGEYLATKHCCLTGVKFCTSKCTPNV